MLEAPIEGPHHCILQPGTPMSHRHEANWDNTLQQEPRDKPQSMGGCVRIPFSVFSRCASKSVLRHMPCTWETTGMPWHECVQEPFCNLLSILLVIDEVC